MDGMKSGPASNDSYTAPTPDAPPSFRYTYQPLTAHNSIRLLNLLPCEDSDPNQSLKCNLTVVSLSDNPSFVALSYTWGENVFPEKLYCHDGALDITTNLHSALLRFRLADKPLRIWVDAVCINQANGDEKTRQIPLMTSIYGQATEVLIWLGEASEDSEDVMKYLKRIGQRFLDRGGPINEPRDERSPENDLIWADVTEDPNLEKTVVIWARPWFSRRWIIQEMALAQKATVHCGTVSMDWNVLSHANQAISRLAGDGSQYWNKETKKIRQLRAMTMTNMWKLNHIREQIWTNSQSPPRRRIHELLDHARAFDCRDAKDRVFALLAIFNRGREEPLKIDYSKSEAEVYIAFTRYCLQNDITVDILSLAGTTNHSLIPDSLNLPSWVPNCRLPFRSPTDTLNSFDAGYRLASSIALPSDPESRELLARGIIVDKIAAFVHPISSFHKPGVPSPFVHSQPATFLKPAHIATWYEQVELVLCHVFKTSYPTPTTYIGGGDIWEALARTLIIDREDVVFDLRRDKPESADATSTPLWQEWKGFSNHMLKCAQEAREGKKEEGEEPKLMIISYEQMEYHIRPPLLCEDRCFFITQRGYIGLGPKDVKEGDVVVVLAGSGVPHIVRPESGTGFNLFRMFGDLVLAPVPLRQEALFQMPDGERRPYILRDQEERFSLVGEAYVQGLMNDEVWDLKGVFFEDLKLV